MTILGLSVMGHLTETPSSIMTALDERVVLKCTTNDTSSYIEWTFAEPQWTSSRLLSRGKSLKPFATERNMSFGNTITDAHNPLEYNFRISLVRMHHSGIYVCQECSTENQICRAGAAAELIVLKYKPLCNLTVKYGDTDGAPGTVIAGQYLDFACLLAYNSTLRKISMRWTDGHGIDVEHNTTSYTRESWINVESRVRLIAVSPRVHPYTFIACLPIGEHSNCRGAPGDVTATRPAIFTWKSFAIEVSSNQPATKHTNIQTSPTAASAVSGISKQLEITYSDVKTQFTTKYLDAFNLTTLQIFTDFSGNSNDVSSSEQNLFSSNPLYICLVTCGLFVVILLVYSVLRACVSKHLRNCRKNPIILVTSSGQSALSEDLALENITPSLDNQLQEIETYDQIRDSKIYLQLARPSTDYPAPNPDRPQMDLPDVPILVRGGIYSSLAEPVLTTTDSGGKRIYLSLVEEAEISTTTGLETNFFFVSHTNLTHPHKHQNVNDTIGLTYCDFPRPCTM